MGIIILSIMGDFFEHCAKAYIIGKNLSIIGRGLPGRERSTTFGKVWISLSGFTDDGVC